MRRSWRQFAGDQGGSMFEAIAGYGMIIGALIVAATVLPASAKSIGRVMAHDQGASMIYNSVEHFMHDCSSARACDVLPTDVLGADNSDGHEWAALFQDSSGNYTILRFLWNSQTHTLQAYKYVPGQAPAPYGPAISSVAFFQATDVRASAEANAASPHYLPLLAATPANVDVPTQYAGFFGGNHYVEIRMVNDDADETIDVMPGGAADTGLTTITNTYAPPPPSSCTFVASYAGSAAAGFTPVLQTALWQWFQPAPPCVNANTPPPVTYTSSYSPNCDASFYAPVTSTAAWQQQPAPVATTPPPTQALVGYANGDPLQPQFQTFAWSDGPCPHPTNPPDVSVPTPPPACAVDSFGFCIVNIVRNTSAFKCTSSPIFDPVSGNIQDGHESPEITGTLTYNIFDGSSITPYTLNLPTPADYDDQCQTPDFVLNWTPGDPTVITGDPNLP